MVLLPVRFEASSPKRITTGVSKPNTILQINVRLLSSTNVSMTPIYSNPRNTSTATNKNAMIPNPLGVDPDIYLQ